jgi:hypothetical protein
MRSLALAVCLAALALVAAGCGGDGDSGASPDEWADEFCGHVRDWENDLREIRDEFGDVSSLTADSIEQAAEDADAATDEFVENIRDLGAPDTDSGDAVEQEAEEFADTVEAEKEEIRDATEDLSDLGDVADAIGSVGESLSTLLSAGQETLEAIADADVGGEVRTALEESETCDEIGD